MPTQEHQTRITGYRELTAEEIAQVNDIKAMATGVGEMLDQVKLLPDVDQRALAIARTELQTGFMWLVRSITRPQGF